MSARRDDELFGEVRSLLAREPCEELFAQVCALWGNGEVRGEILDYIQSITSRWPEDDIPCTVPVAWRERVERGERCPGVALCKTLVIEHGRDISARVMRWARCEDVTGLRSLEVDASRARFELPVHLFESPHFARVRKLKLRGVMHLDHHARVLVSSALMRGLEALHLEHMVWDEHLVEVLREASTLAGVRALTLSACKLDDAQCAIWLDVAHLGALTRLDLSYNTLTRRSVEALSAHFTAHPTLRALNLSVNPLGDEGITQLVSDPAFSTLEGLDLAACQFSPKGFRAMARSYTLPRLTSLVVRANVCDEEAMRGLVTSSFFSQLTRLDMAACRLNARCVDLLAGSMYAHGIRHLELAHNDIGDEGALAIAVSTSLEGLRELGVSGCGLGDEGIEALSQATFFNALERFEYADNRIGERGVYALWSTARWRDESVMKLHEKRLTGEAFSGVCEQPALARIERLEVRRCEVDGGFMLVLALAGGFRGLRECEFSYTTLDASGWEMLARWPRLAQLERLTLRATGDPGVRGIRALCASPFLVALTVLDCSQHTFTTDMFEVLCVWGGLAHLRELRLDACGLHAADVERLLDEALTPELEVLSCLDNVLDGAIERLARLAHERGVRLSISSLTTMDIFPMEMMRGMVTFSPDDYDDY